MESSPVAWTTSRHGRTSPAKTDPGPRYDWDREFQVWPRDFVPPSPPPFIRPDCGAPDAAGQVQLPYRPGGQNEWNTLNYEVKMYPGEVKLLSEVNDHVLFATDSGYGQHVFYDLRTNEIKRIGGTISPYSLGFFRDRLYVSGYPSSQMVEYDFTRPLGLKQEPPNPKRLGHPPSDTHIPLGGTVGGADGRVYNGGTTVGRRRVGGGLGWYDTATGKLGGMPLEDHRVFWMTSAADARYIVLSTKCEGQGQLLVWDTQAQQLPSPYRSTLRGHAAGADRGSVAGPGDGAHGRRRRHSVALWIRPVDGRDPVDEIRAEPSRYRLLACTPAGVQLSTGP